MELTISRPLGISSAFAASMAIAMGFLVLSTSVVEAQSRYGCSALEGAHVPNIEGLDGFFFRIDPDLLTYNRMTDETVAGIAEISVALAAHGTELVVVPLVTKALAMPSKVGPEAEKYVFSADLAATMYQDQIDRLTLAGVATVDARLALLDASGTEPVFFKTDPRLTNHGLKALAKAIADGREAWPAGDGPGYVTTEEGPIVLRSKAHDVLQMSCLSDLPAVETTVFQTVAKGADYAMEDGPRVVFTGTSHTADASLNLSGFLSELAGEKVSVIDGGESALEAMSAYLTSDAFRRSRPEVLIWAVPTWENLALGGDQPFREALAAVEDVCVSDLDIGLAGPNLLRVALGEAVLQGADTLFLDNSGVPDARAGFHFTGLQGQMRTRTVVRADDVPHSGRFYMPLTGLWEDGVAYVDIETPLTQGPLPIVALCRGGE